MQTNPRTQPPEWAPPPPVVTPKRPTPPPLPASMRAPRLERPARPVSGPADEAEFEATLGSLVEHFSSLPPAEFGEPPAMELTSPIRAARSRSRYLVWGAGSLVLGGIIAGSALVGFQLLRARPALAPAQPEVPIVVRPASAPAAVVPETEPLVEEMAAPETTALADEDTPALVVMPTKPAPRAIPRARRTARPRAAAHAEEAPAPALPAGADDGGWEDPYK